MLNNLVNCLLPTPQVKGLIKEIKREFGDRYKINTTNNQKSNQTSNILPTVDTKINVYAGDNLNTDLSNLYDRPFIHTWKDGKTTKFNSVEQAFQFAKARMANDRETARKILNATSGTDAKTLGKQVLNLNTKDWDASKNALMKIFIKESFEQNPQALQRLLSTGNATLTHLSKAQQAMTVEQLTETKTKDNWIEDFPKLLMQVREELAKEKGINLQQQFSQSVEVHKGYWSREEVKNNPDKIYLFGDNTNDRINTHHVPTDTQAVIRGLDNAIGIDTKKDRGTNPSSYFTDADFDIFKTQVDEAINKAKATGKTIVLPENGIGTGKAMLKEKAPKLYNYLQQELNKLSNQSSQSSTQESQNIDDIIKADISAALEMFTLGDKIPSILIMKEYYRIKDSKKAPYILYTGDAKGSDSIWTSKARRNNLSQVVRYAPSHINLDNYKECNDAALKANKTLKRHFPIQPKDDTEKEKQRAIYRNNLILRDYLQVKNCDCVFAISSFTQSESGDTVVAGGTGWAVLMALDMNKPVYLFNQKDNLWYYNNGLPNAIWEKVGTPKLTPKFAGVGTKEITPEGMLAIDDVYKNSIESELSIFDLEKESSDIKDILEKAVMSFSSTREREDRVILIARIFHGEAEELFKQFKKLHPHSKIDIQDYIIEHYLEIINNVKNILTPNEFTISEAESIELGNHEYQALQVIQDNWMTLLSEAANYIYNTDGIALSFTDVTKDVNNASTDELANQDDEINDSEDGETCVKDGWMIKARKVSLENTLSTTVRRLLSNIPKLDKNGEVELDDLGYTRYINPDYAHLKLIEAFSTMYSSNEMDEVLNSMLDKHPWINSIIDYFNEYEELLQEMPNKEDMPISIKALFYHDLRREFIPYWIQTSDNKTKQINKNPGIYYLLNEWRSTYEAGITLDENSIYDKNNKIVSENAKVGFNLIKELQNDIDDDTLMLDYISKNSAKIRKLLNMIGIDFTELEIQNTLQVRKVENAENLTVDENIIQNLDELLSKFSTIFNQVDKEQVFDNEDFINHFDSVYTHIAELFNTIPLGATLATFRELGDNYQSHSAPSYLGRLFNGIKGKYWQRIMEKEYKRYNAFYNKITNEYKSIWLKLLNSSLKYRDLLDKKVLLHKNRKPFNDWNESDYLQACITEFFSIPEGEGIEKYAWYALPLLSDAESAEFIKFVKYTTESNINGKASTVEDKIIHELVQEVLNEYERIQIVLERDRLRTKEGQKIAHIGSYDIQYKKDGSVKGIKYDNKGNVLSREDGAEFKFFTDLNRMYMDDRRYTIIGEKYGINKGTSFIEGLRYMQKNHSSAISEYITVFLKDSMQNGFAQFKKVAYSVYGYKEENPVKDVIRKGHNIDEDLKEFYYNNALAYTQIVRMTTTDLSYYKNLNDFQKRFKEVYGMTLRPYVNSKFGKPTMKVITLKDIKKPADILPHLRSILNNAVKNGQISNIEADYIYSLYREVNVTDAQAYRTLDSYRSAMDMCGRWTYRLEEAYQNIINGTFDMRDFNVMFQTLKPFMYTQRSIDSRVLKNVEVNGITKTEAYGDIKVSAQFKNSEAVLLAIYGAMGGPMAKSGVMQGLNQFMVDNKIDVANFESAYKTGLQGAISLALDFIKSKLNLKDRSKDRVTKEKEAVMAILNESCFINGLINPEVVHTLDGEDWGILVETNEHTLDHNDIIPAQYKKLIESDLPDDIELRIPGINYFKNEYTTKQEAHDMYQECLTENILDGFKQISKDFEDIEVVGKLLQKEMNGNIRYTDEDRKACMIVERNGKKVFNIPIFDPIQSTRIQLIMFSIIKKKVTKQTIRRATCPLISNFGFTDELQIRYYDKDNKLVDAKISELVFEENVELKSKFKTYAKYEKYYNDLREANRVAYWECYLPATSRDYFEAFIDDDGKLDIEKVPEELRRAIGLRTPTEDKYSMQPLYIKGFLPTTMSTTIMLPSEVTTIVGSDFDIDKVFICLHDFEIIRYDMREAVKAYNRELNITGDVEKQVTDDKDIDWNEIKEDRTQNGQLTFKSWFKANRERFKLDKPEIKLIRYNPNRPLREQSKKVRNNLMLDISWAILTNEKTAVSMHTPGGFEEPSRIAAFCDILKNLNEEEIGKLAKLDTSSDDKVFKKALNVLRKKDRAAMEEQAEQLNRRLNPLSILTQLFFHAQNANGSKQIAKYAIASSAHAEGQWCNIEIKNPILIFGKTLKKIDAILNLDNQRISNLIGTFIAASVDNAKKPVLKSLNQNNSTSYITTMLLRAGLSTEEVSLFMNAPLTKEFDKDPNIPIIELNIDNIAWLIYVSNNKDYIFNDKTTQLKQQLLKSVSFMYQNIVNVANDLRQITSASRGDTTGNAGGPTIGHIILRYLKLKQLQEDMNNEAFTLTADVLNLDYILNDSYTDEVLYDCYKSGVPFLLAATKCGVVGPMNIMKKYFPQLQPQILDILINKDYGLRRYSDFTLMSEEKAIKLINKFYNEMIVYMLSGSNFLGDNARNIENYQRIYMTYALKFPELLLKVKTKYFLQVNEFINALSINNENKFNLIPGIKFKNTGSISKLQRIKIIKDWESLIKGGDKEVRDLTFLLFKYGALFGLHFTGMHRYIQFAPNLVRLYSEEYLKTLDNFENASTEELKPFVEQFVRNNIDDFGLVTVELDIDGNISNGKMLDEKLILAPLYRNKRINFIRLYNDKTREITYYKLTNPISSDVTNEENTNSEYILVTPLGHKNGLLEYYYGQENVNTVLPQGNVLQSQLPAETVTDYTEEEMAFRLEQVRLQEGEGLMFEEDNFLFDPNYSSSVAIDPATGQPMCK